MWCERHLRYHAGSPRCAAQRCKPHGQVDTYLLKAAFLCKGIHNNIVCDHARADLASAHVIQEPFHSLQILACS